MMLSELQRYCLQEMGITLWEKRTQTAKRFLFVCTEPLTGSLMEMVERMCLALKWPQSETAIMSVKPPIAWFGAIFDNPVERVLLSHSGNANIPVNVNAQIVQIPSLRLLIENVTAKRDAWQKMQSLVFD